MPSRWGGPPFPAGFIQASERSLMSCSNSPCSVFLRVVHAAVDPFHPVDPRSKIPRTSEGKAACARMRHWDQVDRKSLVSPHLSQLHQTLIRVLEESAHIVQCMHTTIVAVRLLGNLGWPLRGVEHLTSGFSPEIGGRPPMDSQPVYKNRDGIREQSRPRQPGNPGQASRI